MPTLRLDIWSDIACPWCYVGKRRIEGALAGFAHADQVAVHWRAFELDPSAPRVRDGGEGYAARLARKYGSSRAKAEARLAHMTELAATDGLDFRFDRIQPGNTFDAHRLLHLAGERGVQDALKERLLHAYMTEGQAIGLPEVLAPLAREAGLDEPEVRALLDGDRFAAEVRADEAEAHALGIGGVPFFVLDGRLGVSGAHTSDVLRGALERAWSELRPAPLEAFAEGAACGPDGCD